MISILTEENELPGLDSLLGEADLEASQTTINEKSFSSESSSLYLCSKKTNVTQLARSFQKLKKAYPNRPITACLPEFPESDKNALLECGINKIISPASWARKDVGSRIIGDAFLSFKVNSLDHIVGGSRLMKPIYEEVQAIAPMSDPALIVGETGAGKELFTKALHDYGHPNGEFLPVNCAALTPDRVESELFGHVKGAFSGAVKDRHGLIMEANQGTLFLDEIGELSLTTQAKLLRFVEDGMVRPVGSDHIGQKSHARIVFATHLNLEQAVDEGTFREDLYQRIKVFPIKIPPLRERKEDLPILAHHFLEQIKQERKLSAPIMETSSMQDLLFQYDYPGNVRQLRNAIRYAAAFTREGEPLNLTRLRRSLAESKLKSETQQANKGQTLIFDPASETWKQVHQRIQSQYFKAVLDEANGNKPAAAHLAGMGRATFYENLKKLQDFEDDSY